MRQKLAQGQPKTATKPTALKSSSLTGEFPTCGSLVNWFLAIPHWILLSILGIIALGVWLLLGLAVLLAGRVPGFCYRYLLGLIRYTNRAGGFVWYFFKRYPSFNFWLGDPVDSSGYQIRRRISTLTRARCRAGGFSGLFWPSRTSFCFRCWVFSIWRWLMTGSADWLAYRPVSWVVAQGAASLGYLSVEGGCVHPCHQATSTPDRGSLGLVGTASKPIQPNSILMHRKCAIIPIVTQEDTHEYDNN